jgi:acyl-CoA thioesterase
MEGSAFGSTLDTRVLGGGLREPGPGVMWVRFGHEHVEGVALTPLVRVAVLGDFGSGLGSVLPVRGWNFPNLDISVHLTRLPEGEWLLIDAETISAGNGMALASTVMADRQGVFARTHQTLFVSLRHQAGG